MKRPQTRFRQACDERAEWGRQQGYDGWTKPPDEIFAERQEEAIDIPVWGYGVDRRLLNRRQRLRMWLSDTLAAIIWHNDDQLRRSLK